MAKRPGKGFKRASTLLQERVRKAGESRGFAVSRVLTHWAEIVGGDIASIARPVDVSYGRQGMGATLTMLTTGAQAPMLEMQKDQIRARVNAAYGYNAITRIRITQTAATGFAEGRASFEPASTKGPRREDPEIKRRAKSSTSEINDPSLKSALETLARNVLSTQKR